MKDGEHYSKIERNADGGFDVMAYMAKDNSKEVLIPASLLVNPEGKIVARDLRGAALGKKLKEIFGE
jgi:hypothetical protein